MPPVCAYLKLCVRIEEVPLRPPDKTNDKDKDERVSSRTLVTGATGNVGRAVVDALSRRGMAVRAAGSAPERLRAMLGSDVEVVRLDFWDPSTFAPALAGCDGVFLMRPPAIAQVRRTLIPFLDAARSAGVSHVVFLSVQGAERNRLIPHHAVEQHLIRGQLPYTLLRPGFFAQNLGDAYRRDICEDGRLYVPAGQGRVAFIDTRDIAEVAATCFAHPRAHQRQAYSLTGAEALSFAQVAQLLTAALSRPVHYEPATLLGYIGHLRRRGLPWPQVAVLSVLHLGLRLGQAAAVDPTLARLLGSSGHSMRDYICEHAELWRAPGSS